MLWDYYKMLRFQHCSTLLGGCALCSGDLSKHVSLAGGKKNHWHLSEGFLSELFCQVVAKEDGGRVADRLIYFFKRFGAFIILQ